MIYLRFTKCPWHTDIVWKLVQNHRYRECRQVGRSPCCASTPGFVDVAVIAGVFEGDCSDNKEMHESALQKLFVIPKHARILHMKVRKTAHKDFAKVTSSDFGEWLCPAKESRFIALWCDEWNKPNCKRVRGRLNQESALQKRDRK